MIAWGVSEVLPDSEIPFGGLNRCVTEADLDLLEWRSPFVRQLRKRPPEIVRANAGADVLLVSFHYFVNRLRAHSLPRDPIAFVDPAEHCACVESGRREPFIERGFGPPRHGYGTNAVAFAGQVDDAPTALPLLDALDLQARQFLAA